MYSILIKLYIPLLDDEQNQECLNLVVKIKILRTSPLPCTAVARRYSWIKKELLDDEHFRPETKCGKACFIYHLPLHQLYLKIDH